MSVINEKDASILVEFFKEKPEENVTIESLTEDACSSCMPSMYCVLNPKGKIKALMRTGTDMLKLMPVYPGLIEKPDEPFGGDNLVPYFQDFFRDLKEFNQFVPLYGTCFFQIPENIDKLDELVMLETHRNSGFNHITEIPENAFRAPKLNYLCVGPDLEKLPELDIDSTNLKVLNLNEAIWLIDKIPRIWTRKANDLGIKIVKPFSIHVHTGYDTNTLLAMTVYNNKKS